MDSSSGSKWGDVLKFMLLVVIMLGAILVVSVVRPLVFGQIVPAVVGDFLTPIPTIGVTEPPAAPTVAVTEMPAATATPEPPAAASTPETAPPTPRVHIIQPGENLTQIADTYSVTIADILTLNRLANPNQIGAGEQLLIPDK